MSGACARFRQNTWKKEMCSNCYKTREEHVAKAPRPSLPAIPLLMPPSQGILKGWDKEKLMKKRKSVSFPIEESEVIGYGGEECSSDDDEEEDVRDGDVVDDGGEVEDDKDLMLLTKVNTDFNSELGNLGVPVRTVEEPVMVTVRPFCQTERQIVPVKACEEETKEVCLEPQPKKEEVCETRKVSITRGTVLTKIHESMKNKLYIQNIINSKHENKRSSFSMIQDKEEETVMQSREMAGEPDGRADSDEAEVPVTPPPRTSFLHREVETTSPEGRIPKRQAPQPPLEAECETESESIHTPEPPESPVEQQPRLSPKCDSPETPPGLPPPEQQQQQQQQQQQPRPSPKREPPPLPPSTPEPKSPPEPLPRQRADKKAKMKDTIKKFLRLTNRDEVELEVHNPRPRPHIIHPLDLNKSGVQVVTTCPVKKSPESPNGISHTCPLSGRPSKPPPPPRSESLNLMERLKATPPGETNIYANLGEARSGIAPAKPQRTGSVREASRPVDQEGLYEAIGSTSSAPECDMESRSSLPYCGSETESDTYCNPAFHSEGSRTRLQKPVTVYSTVEENFAALAEYNLKALTAVLTQMTKKERNGTMKLSDFWLKEEDRKEVGEVVFVRAKASNDGENTLAILPAESTLVFSPCLVPVATFTDQLPPYTLPCQKATVPGEVSVLDERWVERLTEYSGAGDWDEAALVVLQMIHVVEHVLRLTGLDLLQLRFPLSNFLVLRDSSAQPVVAYIHNKVLSEGGEDWRRTIVSGCEVCGVAAPLRERLCGASLAEARQVVEAWLWGPPPSLPPSQLHPWLRLQRAAVLAALLAQTSTALRLQLAFLATNPDLSSLLRNVILLHLPVQSPHRIILP